MYVDTMAYNKTVVKISFDLKISNTAAIVNKKLS